MVSVVYEYTKKNLKCQPENSILTMFLFHIIEGSGSDHFFTFLLTDGIYRADAAEDLIITNASPGLKTSVLYAVCHI